MSSISPELVEKYARGLFNALHSTPDLHRALVDLRSVAKFLKRSPKMQQVLAHPRIEILHKRYFLSEGLKEAQIMPQILALMAVMITSKRILDIEKVAEKFQDLVDCAEGIMRAEVAVTETIDQTVLENIQNAFDTLVPQKILWRKRIDNEILAGYIVWLDGKVYDSSLKLHMMQMRENLVAVS